MAGRLSYDCATISLLTVQLSIVFTWIQLYATACDNDLQHEHAEVPPPPAIQVVLAEAELLQNLDHVVGSSPLVGLVSFVQPNPPAGDVRVVGQLFNHGEGFSLSPGAHGFHVHEFGNTLPNCEASGHHFNPFQAVHGGRVGTSHRHLGDLGNVYVDFDGTSNFDFFVIFVVYTFSINYSTTRGLGRYLRRMQRLLVLEMAGDALPLTGPNTIVGRTLVLHRDEDDLGAGFSNESLITGNSGPRLACGIINLATSFKTKVVN